jgi:3-oxoacyl-[acyl-carrier protein] reductase
MSERIILITGANGELGLAMARAFLQESPNNVVWLGVNRRREAADQLAATDGKRCRVVGLDVTKPDAWKQVVGEIVAAHQRLDVLVNNAGVHEDMLLAQMSPKSWHKVVSINLDGVFHGCQAVLPTMIGQRGGRIINIASLSALYPPIGQCNYAAAKAGVVALTQSLGREVARIGITVNAVCPGYFDTAALGPMDAAQRKGALERIPMRRFGRPEELAATVRFLACPEAGYITSSALKIDGGIL